MVHSRGRSIASAISAHVRPARSFASRIVSAARSLAALADTFPPKSGGEVATSKPIEGDAASKNVSTARGEGTRAEAASGYHGGMETRPPAAPFRLGIAEGVIPRKWVRRWRSEEHTSELQSRFDLVCRLL